MLGEPNSSNGATIHGVCRDGPRRFWTMVLCDRCSGFFSWGCGKGSGQDGSGKNGRHRRKRQGKDLLDCLEEGPPGHNRTCVEPMSVALPCAREEFVVAQGPTIG